MTNLLLRILKQAAYAYEIRSRPGIEISPEHQRILKECLAGYEKDLRKLGEATAEALAAEWSKSMTKQPKYKIITEGTLFNQLEATYTKSGTRVIRLPIPPPPEPAAYIDPPSSIEIDYDEWERGYISKGRDESMPAWIKVVKTAND